jgi:hypothetical protein
MGIFSGRREPGLERFGIPWQAIARNFEVRFADLDPGQPDAAIKGLAAHSEDDMVEVEEFMAFERFARRERGSGRHGRAEQGGRLGVDVSHGAECC